MSESLLTQWSSSCFFNGRNGAYLSIRTAASNSEWRAALLCILVYTFALHSLRRQQRQHWLVHGGRARVWPCAGLVSLLLWSVHHEAVLPRPRQRHSQLPTGPGWQDGHPAALRSVTIWTCFVLCIQFTHSHTLIYDSPLCGPGDTLIHESSYSSCGHKTW